MIFKLIVYYILSIYFVIVIHELLHFLIAKLFKYDPDLRSIGILPIKVEYTNENKPLENLFISAVPPLTLFILGILIPLNYYTVILKLTCTSNFFNLLPITADGEVILLSLVQILRREK